MDLPDLEEIIVCSWWVSPTCIVFHCTSISVCTCKLRRLLPVKCFLEAKLSVLFSQ